MISEKANLTIRKSFGVKLVIIWVAVNIVMMAYMILSHQEIDSMVEMLLWAPSIVGLWKMKMWGASLTIATLGITLGISLNNLLLTYSASSPVLMFVPINSLRIIFNAAAIVYLFTRLFKEKFQR